MTSNSPAIIQDLRAEFEHVLEFVTGEQARTTTADQIERGLFKLLLKLGASLLGLFFVMRSEASSRQAVQLETGEQLAYHRDTPRTYFSIFGKVVVERPYFYQTGVGGRSPLDAALSLGEDCYSDVLREVADYLGVYSVYGKSAGLLERWLGLDLSTRTLQENIAEDAAEVEAYYAQKPPPSPESEAAILVIQADGKGVPVILEPVAPPKLRLGKGEKRGHKKEAIVTTVYTIAAMPRTPEQVVASLFDPAPTASGDGERASPQHKQVWATLQGKDAALSRLTGSVAARQGDHIQHQVALCDGCEALQTRLASHFPDFSQVLDFIHANEYLWDVANSLLGETHPQRTEWMKRHTLSLLSGQTAQLIQEFRQWVEDPATTPAQRKQLTTTANYFERNLPFMDYPSYLANGWPIASGVIEGACRHLVKDRCELSGMRWLPSGAENLLRLRAVAENDDWDDYHAYRKQQRHARLYGSPQADQEAPELQAIRFPTAAYEPVSSGRQITFDPLPLAA